MRGMEMITEPTRTLWPELWLWLPQLSECELKVWLYLRAWLPGGGQPAEIPLRQIQQGTGLSRSSVIRGQAGLRTKRLLGGEERSGGATRYWWPSPVAGSAANAPAVAQPHGAAPSIHPVEICDGGGESNRIESNHKITKESDSIRATAHSDTRRIEHDPAVTASLEAYMRQITAQFQPGAGPMALKANITRLLRLWHTGGHSEAAFTDLLQTAIERTEARMARPGARPVACPMSYLFTVLERLLASGSAPQRGAGSAARFRALAPAPSAIAANQVSTPPEKSQAALTPSAEEYDLLPTPDDSGALPGVPAVTTGDPVPNSLDAPQAIPLPDPSRLPSSDLARLWQQALVLLRLEQSPDDFQRILRYTVLQEHDPVAGRVFLAVPADWMRRQIMTRLAEPIRRALALVLGSPVEIAVTLFGPVGSLCCTD